MADKDNTKAEAVELTEAEVKQHDTAEDLWMIIDNNVYNVTAFLDEHPGGSDILVENGGLNATLAFEEVGHSEDARKLMEKYKIGSVKGGSHKYCFRVQQEDTPAMQDKSMSITRTSSVRICLPASTGASQTRLNSTEPERTKSVTNTPSRVRCISCCGMVSKTALDKRSKSASSTKEGASSVAKSCSRTCANKAKRVVSSKPSSHSCAEPSKIKPAISSKPSSHASVDASKIITKPVASSKPGSYTNTSRTKAVVVPRPSQTSAGRPTTLNTTSSKTSVHFEPTKTKSVVDSVSSRHKKCFEEPPEPWLTKSGQGQKTPPTPTRTASPNRHKKCFEEPAEPWLQKSGQGQKTPPSPTRSASPATSASPNRHMRCFEEPPEPWRPKPVQKTPPGNDSPASKSDAPSDRCKSATCPANSCEACTHLPYSKKDFDAAQKLKDIKAGKLDKKSTPKPANIAKKQEDPPDEHRDDPPE